LSSSSPSFLILPLSFHIISLFRSLSRHSLFSCRPRSTVPVTSSSTCSPLLPRRQKRVCLECNDYFNRGKRKTL
jgi:hypothetical protein